MYCILQFIQMIACNVLVLFSWCLNSMFCGVWVSQFRPAMLHVGMTNEGFWIIHFTSRNTTIRSAFRVVKMPAWKWKRNSWVKENLKKPAAFDWSHLITMAQSVKNTPTWELIYYFLPVTILLFKSKSNKHKQTNCIGKRKANKHLHQNSWNTQAGVIMGQGNQKPTD